MINGLRGRMQCYASLTKQPVGEICSWTAALGGEALAGIDVTHFVYLDESGISGGDRVTVVSGPIVDSRRALSIQAHMRSTMWRLLDPNTLPDDFVISAKDLYHGAGSFKDEARWPRARRMEILEAILGVPRLFQLAVILGWHRRDHKEEGAQSPRDRLAVAHARAFMLAASPMEKYMRDETSWDSCAMMILENNTDTRSAVRNMQRKLRSPRYVAEQLDPQLRPYFPLTKVLEDPLFAEKAWSNLLLMADACAFCITRWMMGNRDMEPLLAILLGSMRPEFPDRHMGGSQLFKFGP